MNIRRSSTPRIAWWILAVLGLIFALFAGDRAVLGILKTTLGSELHLTNSGYSLLVTCFMVPYTAMYFFVGGWIDRFGAKRMLGLCVLGMSLATVVAGTAHAVPQLALSRLILGVAEAGVVPAITLAIFTWFASERRALAYSLANTVQQSAYILAPPFVAGATLMLGWRWSFLIPGLSGFLIAGLWWQVNRRAGAPPPIEPEAAAPAGNGDDPGLWARMRLLLALPSVRLLIIARVVSDPFWFFFQYWQTAFLQERVGLSLARVGQLTWIPPLAYMGAALGFSAFSDKLVARGWPAPKARLVLLLGATAFAPAAFCLPLVRGEWTALALVTLVWVMCATWLNMSSVFMGALVPRHVLASAIGIMSALGGVTSIVFNAVVGPIIDRFGYDAPFWFGACLHPLAAGLLAWHFLRPATEGRARVQNAKSEVPKPVADA
jgi:ACS family hexuronate transporter-like MFS transporter